jgi:hypothetical protein
MIRRFLIVLPVLCLGSLWAADQPFEGTWKLNPAKSKSDGPSWKSRTLTLAVKGDLRIFKSEGVTSDGKQLAGGYQAKFDGKDYPISNHVAGAETIALRQESPSAVRFTMKRAGKVVTTGRSAVSADGKTMTITSKGTTADGKAFNSTGVYDKM